jgi:Fur family ferric uptake transcriptional regulator
MTAARRSVAETVPSETAQTLLAEHGARPTRARIAVLSILLAAREALTHHEVERRLQHGHDVDRVTLYRVLEWLTERGLAHKLAGDDRVWRFSVNARGHASGTAHAHFQCNECGKVICLDETRMPPISLPRGFRRRGVEVTVKGSCAACAR